MKEQKRRIIAAALTALIASAALCGCSNAEQTDALPSQNDISIQTYQAQIEFYAAMVTDLQAQLLTERENNYIAECEYKIKIEELENNVKALSDKIGYISTGSNVKSPPEVFKEQSETSNPQAPATLVEKSDYSYTVENGCVTITGYAGSKRQIVIPSDIGGMPVTKIGESAFRDCAITSVIIPDGVKYIDWFAFSGCSILAKISIPSSVSQIGYGAFDRCPYAMMIKCEKGSYAESYAASWGISVSAE